MFVYVCVCRQGNIITCGVVGGYCVVLAVNVYVSTSLSYITLNVLKRFLPTTLLQVSPSLPT